MAHNEKGILLKRITPDEIEKIMEWRTSPEVTAYMYTDPKLIIEDQKKWFEKISNEPTVSYWIIVVGGVDVGVINLYDIDQHNKRCFWAYYIGEPSVRGKGISIHLECNIYDYVFFELGLNKLCGEVLEFNDTVVQIHKRFGSEIEGIFKQHIYKNGKFLDVVRMAILKEKWNKIRSQYKYKKISIEK
ncbi:MAG: UDP-4-amino-4,6-dideoxy-N-acetyl-beta-L-altrosamine N-acetyltransferase [Candidatus Thermoplasmatota archaeon]|nr:UDP-4-amino-4,6-dideoxy-N-acetyl-beta-L-altrosamine N-acetyltransferase [Candidatus Thermoplasmatota archaeon]